MCITGKRLDMLEAANAELTRQNELLKAEMEALRPVLQAMQNGADSYSKVIIAQNKELRKDVIKLQVRVGPYFYFMFLIL